MESILNSVVVAVLTAVLSAVATYLFLIRKRVEHRAATLADATKTQDARIVELERQLAVISAAVVPISTAFQAILIKELTHFHTPELDGLMSRIGPPSSLTKWEEGRLAHLLEQRSTDMGDQITSSERDAARMLPMVMKRAQAEASLIPAVVANTVIQFVSVPSADESESADEPVNPDVRN